MNAPRVYLRIDRIVLNGFAREQRDAVVSALTAELQRQLATPGAAAMLGESRNLASLRPPPIHINGSASDAAFGAAAARCIGGALQA